MTVQDEEMQSSKEWDTLFNFLHNKMVKF